MADLSNLQRILRESPRVLQEYSTGIEAVKRSLESSPALRAFQDPGFLRNLTRLSQVQGEELAEIWKGLGPSSFDITALQGLRQPLILPDPVKLDFGLGKGLEQFHEAVKQNIFGGAQWELMLESISGLNQRWTSLVQEYLQSIRIQFPKLDPFWEDLFSACAGDREAATRVVSRIHWQPSSVYREAIKLRARSEGSVPAQVGEEALIEGLLLALGWERDAEIPLLVRTQSSWVYVENSELARIRPYDLDLRLFWEWVREESCRAAELWLVGQAYAPTIVLEEPPSNDGELHLARFTTSDAATLERNQGGRPFGSGIFADREAFLGAVRDAATIITQRGDRITQERIGEILVQQSLMGPGAPERQLRAWQKEFGFKDWRELRQVL